MITLVHGRTSAAFRVLYPLAFLGAHLGFMPLLLVILPRRVEILAPSDVTAQLSLLLLTGGIVASIAHILAGRWSDRWMARHGDRRLPIGTGLVALVASYAAMAGAQSIPALLGALVLFQVALNLMFAPLGALLADYVEDRNKARMTAWMAPALPLSIALTTPLALAWPAGSNMPFAATAGAVVACVLPLLLMWPIGAGTRTQPAECQAPAPLPVRDFQLAWSSRLLVQCGAALVIHYLYVYLTELPAASNRPMAVEDAAGLLLVAASLSGVAAAIVVGHASDRLAMRRLPIALSAMLTSGGLVLLAVQPVWWLIILAYCMFSAGLTAFLSVDQAMVAQLLGRNPHRGRYLGIMNLTNTLPAIIIPALALGAVRIASGSALTLLIASAAIASSCAAFLVLRIASIR